MKNAIMATTAALVLGILFSVSGFSMTPIDTQPSTDGNFEASLFGVKVRGEVLTVKIKLKNVAGKTIKLQFHYKDAYYVDIENKKKYFALKDSEGKYIAGPQDRDSEGGKVERHIESDGRTIIWIKWPAPPESTDSVDIIFPGILPFEAVKISR